MAKPARPAAVAPNASSNCEGSLDFGHDDVVVRESPLSSLSFLKFQLNEPFLCLNERSLPRILKHVDCFLSQSRGNESVKCMYLCPSALTGHGDCVWEKFGQAIGNLQGLEML
jgi:hypothetical protein